MVSQACAMRGTRAECANVFAHSICKFEGTDRKQEMRDEHSELREKNKLHYISEPKKSLEEWMGDSEMENNTWKV